jgi:hypothetical protein
MLKLCAIVELEIDWLGVGVLIIDASGLPIVVRAPLQHVFDWKFLN